MERLGFHNPLLLCEAKRGVSRSEQFSDPNQRSKRTRSKVVQRSLSHVLLVDPSHLLSRVKVSQLLSAITASAAWRPERSAPLMDAVSM